MNIKKIYEIREEINELDDFLIYLFFKRLELIQKIGFLKKKYNINLNDPLREKLIIKKCRIRAVKFKIPNKYIELIFNILFIQSKLYEHKIFHNFIH